MESKERTLGPRQVGAEVLDAREVPDYEEFMDYVDPDWKAEAFHIEVVNAYLYAAFSPRKARSSRKVAGS